MPLDIWLNKTKQNKTKQNETKQKQKQTKTKQSKAKQSKAKQNKTKQNKTSKQPTKQPINRMILEQWPLRKQYFAISIMHKQMLVFKAKLSSWKYRKLIFLPWESEMGI